MLNQILIKYCQCSTDRSTSIMISTTEVCVGNSRFIGVAIEEASSVEQPYSWSNPLVVHISSVPWLMRRAKSIHVPVAWNCTIVTSAVLSELKAKMTFQFCQSACASRSCCMPHQARDTPTLGHAEFANHARWQGHMHSMLRTGHLMLEGLKEPIILQLGDVFISDQESFNHGGDTYTIKFYFTTSSYLHRASIHSRLKITININLIELLIIIL